MDWFDFFDECAEEEAEAGQVAAAQYIVSWRCGIAASRISALLRDAYRSKLASGLTSTLERADHTAALVRSMDHKHGHLCIIVQLDSIARRMLACCSVASWWQVESARDEASCIAHQIVRLDYSRALQFLDPWASSWRSIPPLHQASAQGPAVRLPGKRLAELARDHTAVLNGSLLMIGPGGADQIYEPASRTWCQLPAIHTSPCVDQVTADASPQHCAVSFNNRLYAFAMDHIESLDDATHHWVHVPVPPGVIKWPRPEAVATDDKIYVYDGAGESGGREWDPPAVFESGEWRQGTAEDYVQCQEQIKQDNAEVNYFLEDPAFKNTAFKNDSHLFELFAKGGPGGRSIHGYGARGNYHNNFYGNYYPMLTYDELPSRLWSISLLRK